MKIRIAFLISLFSTMLLNAQERAILGSVISDNGYRIPNTTIININTNEKYATNERGEFMVYAKKGDVLRFVKKRYERLNHIVLKKGNYTSLKIVLKQLPKEIKEVKVTYKFKGDLKKDIKHLNRLTKTKKLKQELNSYIANSSSNSKMNDPRAFKQNPLPKYTSGQASANPLAVVGGIINLFSKKEKYRKTYRTKKKFLKEIKSKINKSYYESLGMNDFDIDRFIAFTDERFQLEEKFHDNVDIISIQHYLDKAIIDFKF